MNNSKIFDSTGAMTPFGRYIHWIEQREKVRLAKERGDPKPWTGDTIIQSYRFCNVRRMDDKVSRWLLHNWYLPHFDHPNMLYAVAIARFFNWPNTLALITKDVFKKRIDFEKLKDKLRHIRENINKIFNSAYMVRGNNGTDKIESVIDHNVRNLFPGMVDTNSMKGTHRAIVKAYGFGSFMAGQIVADLRWAMTGEWMDKLDWAPLGPGSNRGMNRLLGRKLKTQMRQSEFEVHLCDLMAHTKKVVDRSIVSRLEAMDYQNTLCEFDKYERVYNGEGRPKSKYSGTI